MRHVLSLLVSCAALALTASARAAEPPTAFPLDASLTVGETTIRYPHELAAQTKEVAKVCEATFPSRLKALRHFSTLQDKVASRVVELLGCPEHAATVQEIVRQAAAGMALQLDLLRDIRLYREADLLAAGGLHEGYVSLTYQPEADQFYFAFDTHRHLPGGTAPYLFLPLPVRRDGTIGSRGRPFAERLAFLSDSLVSSAPLAAHEAADMLLLADLSLRHPYTRWFNEDVGNWVAWQVVQELAPELKGACHDGFLPDAESRALRDQVNLLNWPQEDLAKPAPSAAEASLESADYAYAGEFFVRLLEKQPPDALARVVGKLKGLTSPDTETIGHATKEATGQDAMALLLEYVPPSVRTGLSSGAPSTLRATAVAGAGGGDYATAVKLLSQLLEMTPANSGAHAYLAVCLRHTRAPRDESEWRIRLAAALSQVQTSMPVSLGNASDPEALYVIGRIAQYSGDLQQAADLYAHLPKDHLDGFIARRELSRQNRPAPGPR